MSRIKVFEGLQVLAIHTEASGMVTRLVNASVDGPTAEVTWSDGRHQWFTAEELLFGTDGNVYVDRDESLEDSLEVEVGHTGTVVRWVAVEAVASGARIIDEDAGAVRRTVSGHGFSSGKVRLLFNDGTHSALKRRDCQVPVILHDPEAVAS